MEAKDGSFGFDFEAEYTALDSEKSYTYTFGGRECEVNFNDKENGTAVIVCFDAENENPVEMQQAGWQAILNNFKHYVETGKAMA